MAISRAHRNSHGKKYESGEHGFRDREPKIGGAGRRKGGHGSRGIRQGCGGGEARDGKAVQEQAGRAIGIAEPAPHRLRGI